jgi:hypothetical protein
MTLSKDRLALFHQGGARIATGLVAVVGDEAADRHSGAGVEER